MTPLTCISLLQADPIYQSELKRTQQKTNQLEIETQQKKMVEIFLRSAHAKNNSADDVIAKARELVKVVDSVATDNSDNYKFSPITGTQFAKKQYQQEWLIKPLIVKNQPCIGGGPRKTLKTTLLMDLAISIATGSPFLGQFNVPKKCSVAFISGESGQATLQETYLRICKSKNISPENTNLYIDFRLPQLAQEEELNELAAGLKQRLIDVVIVDPLYLCLLSGEDAQGKQASNIFDMGPLLLKVAKKCLDAGATPILAAHSRKNLNNPLEPLELEDLAFSGIQEFARQWLLLSRRVPYEPGTGTHKLWMVAGGSVGHGGCWGVDIEEGVVNEEFGGRVWNVKLSGYGATIQSKEKEKLKKQEEKKQSQQEKDTIQLQNAIIKHHSVYQEYPNKSELKTVSGFGTEKFRSVFATCLINKQIEVFDSKFAGANGGEHKCQRVRNIYGNNNSPTDDYTGTFNQ